MRVTTRIYANRTEYTMYAAGYEAIVYAWNDRAPMFTLYATFDVELSTARECEELALLFSEAAKYMR